LWYEKDEETWYYWFPLETYFLPNVNLITASVSFVRSEKIGKAFPY